MEELTKFCPERVCPECYGMSWRRPRIGKCPGCGQAYAPETIERIERQRESNWEPR